MAAINQPVGHALSIRDAAVACRLSPRTIRRKLNDGAFPNAYKTAATQLEPEGVWQIPVADLEQAGLNPTLLHPTFTNAPYSQPEPESDGPTVLELVRSDRFGRLRAELAEAVAAAEIALLRAEAERWRVLADERATALERADTALKALTTAMNAGFAPGGPGVARRPRRRRRATSWPCRRSCAPKRCATPRRCRRCTTSAASNIVGGSSGVSTAARRASLTTGGSGHIQRLLGADAGGCARGPASYGPGRGTRVRHRSSNACEPEHRGDPAAAGERERAGRESPVDQHPAADSSRSRMMMTVTRRGWRRRSRACRCSSPGRFRESCLASSAGFVGGGGCRSCRSRSASTTGSSACS